MITLFQFPPSFGLHNASPFCLKLETYLRMAKLPYTVQERADLMKAPKGKMPYIQDGANIIGDSTLVIDYLKATYGDPVDQHLTPQEQAIALAMQRLIEENLYWAMVYSRWEVDENWKLVKAAYFATLPPGVKQVIPALLRKSTRKKLQGHGMGRHNQEEIYSIGKKDITALANFLGDKPFFMGDRPSSLDASAYATLVNLLCPDLKSPLLDQALQFPHLAAYCKRMETEYYAG
jgi:glutathione S-transferase